MDLRRATLSDQKATCSCSPSANELNICITDKFPTD
jgi:hypothetical protein